MGWWIYLDTLDSIKRLELNQEGTKSINKTLAILASFTDDAPQQRTTDIAAKLGLTVSTVSRHLGTLLDWGFLERDDMTGYYRPGSRIITLAGYAAAAGCALFAPISGLFVTFALTLCNIVLICLYDRKLNVHVE